MSQNNNDRHHYFFIPVKSTSERVPGKNFKTVAGTGMKLYQVLPTKIVEAMRQLDMKYTIIMDTDSQEVIDWAIAASRSKEVASSRGTVSYITRNLRFCSNDFGGNFILRHGVGYLLSDEHPKNDPTDVIWQCFVTTPYLSVDTVKHVILTMDRIVGEKLVAASNSQVYDSILTVVSQQGFFWSSGSNPTPIGGYRPEIMLPTQKMPPLYKEIHGMFGITAQAFERYGCRTGATPFFYTVPTKEAIDIDWEEDAVKVFEKEHTPQTTSTKLTSLQYLEESGNQFVTALNHVVKSIVGAAQPQPQTGDQNDPR